MHSNVRQDEKHRTEDGKTDAVVPEAADFEAKGSKDRRAGDLEVEAVFLVREAKITGLIDDEAFKSEVED